MEESNKMGIGSMSVCGLVLILALAMLHGLVLQMWEHYVYLGSSDHRADVRSANIDAAPEPMSRLQLSAFERELQRCTSRIPLSLTQYKSTYWLPASKSGVESLVLDQERACVSRLVSKVAMSDPQSASALAYIVAEAGYSVSGDVVGISRNDPAALRNVANLL